MKNSKKMLVGLLMLSQVMVAGTGKLSKEDATKKANLAILRFKNQFESDNPEKICTFRQGEVHIQHTDVAGIVSGRPKISLLFAQSFGIAQDNRPSIVRSNDPFHQIIATLNQQDDNK